MTNNYSHVLIGGEDNRKIFIEYGEYLKILKFSKAGASDGARGVLLGQKNGENTYILKVIEAVYSGSEGVESPAFSPTSWGRIEAEIKENYKTLSVLGQFSSHPPVTPMRMDYIMQEKYFSEDSNLLFVFDPTDNSEKIYEYNDREFCFLNGFYLFDKFENPIDLTLREAVTRPLLREYELRIRIFDDIKRKIKRQKYSYFVFIIIFSILILYNIINAFRLEKMVETHIFSDRENTQWNKELKP